jgi:hypothetical protein
MLSVQKTLVTAFMCLLIPVFLHYYGPTNFLYFCDLALLVFWLGLVLDSPVLLSAALVGGVLPVLVWNLVFFSSLLSPNPSDSLVGYMFDPEYPLFLRALSVIYKAALPILVLYAVRRVGFDPRGFALWAAVTTPALFVCYLLPKTPADRFTPANINYVHGIPGLVAETYALPVVIAMNLAIAWLLTGFFKARMTN